EVRGARSHAVLPVADARGSRCVLERAVAPVPIEAMARAGGDGRIDERTAVHEEQILPAVVVVVEKQAPAAHDLRKVANGAGPVDVAEVDTGSRCDVDETGCHRLAGYGGSRQRQGGR